MSWLGVGALVASVGPLAHSHDDPATGPHVGAIITNGTVKLGVDSSGNLNVPGGELSLEGEEFTGVRFLKPGVQAEIEYTADGCSCEGWGVADAVSGLTMYANDDAFAGGYAGYALVSFEATTSEAVSVVESTGSTTRILRVTHHYLPSSSDNLYQCNVTIENVGDDDVEDLRYRRVMDWDVEPTAFSEFVTIQGWPATNLFFTSNNGFASADPLAPTGQIAPAPGTNVNFTASGPADHGSVFDFAFGSLPAGASRQFRIFYGGAADLAGAEAALSAVGAEVYSLGQPNLATDHLQYSVAMFAFKGVGENPIADAGDDQVVSTTSVDLDGSGSSDPNDDPLTYSWSEGGTEIATGVAPTVVLTVGVHTIVLTVTDPDGNSDTDEVQIEVQEPDCEAPEVSPATASPAVLWPPNHQMVEVTVDFDVTGGCGDHACVLTVSSDEPTNGLGDGDTDGDWEVVDEHTVRLRAERAGGGDGRVYTITVTCTDEEGGSATTTTTVTVPKSQKK